MRWVWQNVFSLEVPKEWEVRQSEDLIEIAPPQPVGAAHISVLRRTRSEPVQRGEAEELVSNFARKQGVKSCAISEEALGSQSIARTRFQTQDKEGILVWHVEAHVWEERALVCSFCFGGTANHLQNEALAMFASIQPTDTASIH